MNGMVKSGLVRKATTNKNMKLTLSILIMVSSFFLKAQNKVIMTDSAIIKISMNIDSFSNKLANFYYERAKLYQEKEILGLALYDYKKATQLGIFCFIDLGDISYKMGEIEEAHDYYLSHYIKDSTNSETIFKLGLCNYTLHNYKKSIFYFRKSLNLNYLFDNSCYYLGLNYSELNSNDSAISYLSMAQSSVKRNYYLALSFIRKENCSKAVNYLTEVINKDSSDFDTYSKRAMCYFELNQYENAIKDCNKSIELKPDYFAYLILGDCYWIKGNNKQACLNYNKALQLNNRIKIKNFPLKCK